MVGKQNRDGVKKCIEKAGDGDKRKGDEEQDYRCSQGEKGQTEEEREES